MVPMDCSPSWMPLRICWSCPCLMRRFVVRVMVVLGCTCRGLAVRVSRARGLFRPLCDLRIRTWPLHRNFVTSARRFRARAHDREGRDLDPEAPDHNQIAFARDLWLDPRDAPRRRRDPRANGSLHSVRVARAALASADLSWPRVATLGGMGRTLARTCGESAAKGGRTSPASTRLSTREDGHSAGAWQLLRA